MDPRSEKLRDHLGGFLHGPVPDEFVRIGLLAADLARAEHADAIVHFAQGPSLAAGLLIEAWELDAFVDDC